MADHHDSEDESPAIQRLIAQSIEEARRKRGADDAPNEDSLQRTGSNISTASNTTIIPSNEEMEDAYRAQATTDQPLSKRARTVVNKVPNPELKQPMLKLESAKALLAKARRNYNRFAAKSNRAPDRTKYPKLKLTGNMASDMSLVETQTAWVSAECERVKTLHAESKQKLASNDTESEEDDPNDPGSSSSSDRNARQTHLPYINFSMQSEVLLEGGGSPPQKLVTCCVCYDNLDAGASYGCMGQHKDSHTYCHGCLFQWITKSIENNHMQQTIQKTMSGNSLAGEVPCIFFLQDQCAQGALGIPANIPEDVLKKYIDTKVQVRVAEECAPKQAASSLGKDYTPVEKAYQIFMAAIEHCKAGTLCPGCRIPYQKADNCTHMKCSKCNIDFCFVCGHNRGNGDRCGCPSFLEDIFGWRGSRSETAEEKAHWDFLLKRTVWVLNSVKMLITETVWDQMVDAHPDMFNNVFNGRSITLDEINVEGRPPLANTDLAKRAGNVNLSLLIARLDRDFGLTSAI